MKDEGRWTMDEGRKREVGDQRSEVKVQGSKLKGEKIKTWMDKKMDD